MSWWKPWSAPTDSSFRNWLSNSLHSRGVVATARAVADYPREVLFDRRYGLDTLGRESLDGRTLVAKNLAHANPYKGIYSRGFRTAMRRFGIPARGTFVDYGAGKGRALVLALEYGFRSVIGVEFAAEFCAAGEQTLEAYRRRRRPNRAPFEARMVHGDAADYAIDPDDTVFFLYNPFTGPVMSAVLDNIAESVRTHPRDVWIVYANPTEDLHALDGRFERIDGIVDASVGAIDCFRPRAEAPAAAGAR